MSDASRQGAQVFASESMSPAGRQNEELRIRLAEAEDTLAAIRQGDVDALIVGSDIYTLDSSNAATNKLRQDVLAQMEDAVVACDDAGHMICLNPAAERPIRRRHVGRRSPPSGDCYEERWPMRRRSQRAAEALERDGVSRCHRCR